MYTLFITLIIIAAILLVLLVLIQNSKGGGLAADFAGGNQVMGAPKTADFLEKATWTLIAVIAVLSILAVGVHKQQVRELQQAGESAIQSQVQDAAAEQQTSTATPDFGE